MRTDERRRSARFEVDGLNGRFQFTLDVAITNLSLSGMAVETSARLGVHRQYTFKVSDGGQEVTLPGTVAWCVLDTTRKDNNGNIHPVYRAGIRFGDVLTEQAQELLELIERNAVIEPGQRLFGRFELKAQGALHLDSSTDFTVLKLSASGMLVEATLPPALDSIVAVDMGLNGTRLTGTARVAFVEDTDGSDRTRVGLEFIDLTPEGQDAVNALIAAGLHGPE